MPFVASPVVVIVVNPMMAMVMACTGATQERHRAFNELVLRDGGVLVGVERVEQDFGTTRGT
jgi:hypothetical protein